MPKTKLAINGGTPVIPEGTIKKWPPIDELDRKMVLASLDQESHSFSTNCKALEEEFAAWNGNKFAITTNSGTAALHMSLVACDCGAGDHVIVPAFSWSSSATCIMQHNCVPVFVDIEFDTMNIDVDKIEAAITPKTKAIIVVHLYGLPVNMEKVMAIAEKHGLKVIEDACQAHGAKFNGRKAGTLGHCAAFSLNQNKMLCGGEGGIFVTDDEEMLNKAKSLWSFGETRTPLEDRDYHVYAMGWMYRNDELGAAFARAQLKKLDGYLAQTKANAMRLHECLQGGPYLILPTQPDGCEHNWYNYTIRFDMEALGHVEDAGAFRDRIVAAVKAEGAPLSTWQRFILPAMTVFRSKNAYGHGCPWSCPHTEPADCSPHKYPVAQKQVDTHAAVIVPLRPPNEPDVADLVATSIRKVMDNLDQL